MIGGNPAYSLSQGDGHAVTAVITVAAGVFASGHLGELTRAVPSGLTGAFPRGWVSPPTGGERKGAEPDGGKMRPPAPCSPAGRRRGHPGAGEHG